MTLLAIQHSRKAVSKHQQTYCVPKASYPKHIHKAGKYNACHRVRGAKARLCRSYLLAIQRQSNVHL
jgi:hypothetical protein